MGEECEALLSFCLLELFEHFLHEGFVVAGADHPVLVVGGLGGLELLCDVGVDVQNHDSRLLESVEFVP